MEVAMNQDPALCETVYAGALKRGHFEITSNMHH